MEQTDIFATEKISKILFKLAPPEQSPELLAFCFLAAERIGAMQPTTQRPALPYADFSAFPTDFIHISLKL